MNYDVTIVIPTYNGEFRISKVIECLATQINIEQLSWEIVVVDNNSRDKTADTVRNLQRNWRRDIPLRYVFEPRQGLAYARQCGVEHARGNIVGFLDDDNWPTSNWVCQLFRFSNTNPKAGAFNGIVEGIFEESPNQELKPLMRFLAIRHHGSHPKKFQVDKLQLPPGAGLVVRKEAWLSSVPKELHNITRGGDDYEISLYMAKKNWEIWYNPSLKINHFIPRQRLESQYLLGIAHLYGIKTCSLMMVSRPFWQKPLIASKCFLGGLKRIFIKLIKFPIKKNNLEFKCHFLFDLGTIRGVFMYFVGIK